MINLPINSIEVSDFPVEVQIIFKIFGDKIRLVGGCVRDYILDQKINDYDFACKLLPNEIENILTQNNIKSIPTSIKHGTITAVINNQNFQITTLRRDKNHLGRDCEVDFTNDFFEDAKRRDFTVNALYIDYNGKIYDYFNGLEDLKNKKICFIGDAKTRINEDFLRILRFFRFSCYFSNNFDEIGLKNSIDLKENLQILSKERIRDEFIKIVNCSNHLMVLNALKIFYENDFDQILWHQKIDIMALKNILKYQDFIDKNDLFLVKFCAIFFDQYTDFTRLFNDLKFTNFEKKFFKNFREFYENNKNLENFSNAKINELALFYKKNILINFLILFVVKNNQKFQENYLENIINYVINLEIPSFILNINDLKLHNCPDNLLNFYEKKLKILWAKSDFKLTKVELLNSLKEI
ncbi:MAG: CCA tRNA nucleotidyltransferase [Alphaproteobacteria bacterium]